MEPRAPARLPPIFGRIDFIWTPGLVSSRLTPTFFSYLVPGIPVWFKLSSARTRGVFTPIREPSEGVHGDEGKSLVYRVRDGGASFTVFSLLIRRDE